MKDLTGKTIIVTGGTSGLGFFTAKGLAKRDATVIIAGQNVERGMVAANKIKKSVDGADVTFMKLNLADKNSIRDFAKQIKKLDVLVCNAGIMMPNERRMTNYGVESQFGINYLGHFMLTALLLPLLKSSRGRVVTVSSIANNPQKFDLCDATGENKYYPFRLYALSKLAAAMFALELDKLSLKNGWGVSAVPFHPGLVRTRLFSRSKHPFVIFSNIGTKLPIISMSSRWAARLEIFAAVSKKAEPGVFYGPFLTFVGGPRRARLPKLARDLAKRRELWEFSEKMTKTKID